MDAYLRSWLYACAVPIREWTSWRERYILGSPLMAPDLHCSEKSHSAPCKPVWIRFSIDGPEQTREDWF